MTEHEMDQVMGQVEQTIKDQAIRIAELERAMKQVIHHLTYGESSWALMPGSLSLDDDTKADLRWCLTRLREGLA